MLNCHQIIVFKKPTEPENRSSPGDSISARRKRLRKNRDARRVQPVIAVEGVEWDTWSTSDWSFHTLFPPLRSYRGK